MVRTRLARWTLVALAMGVGLATALGPGRPPPTAAARTLTLTAGGAHTCALLGDGTARCWGYNLWGQLGDNSTTDRHTPVAVSGLSNAVAVAAGQQYTCALLSDGSARCWGRNDFGQLGDNSTTDRHTPVAVSGLSNAVAISAGFYHTCALLSDGTAQCWGDNGNGQLGDNSTTDRHTPVAVSGLSNAVAIDAGDYDTCALLRDGSAQCWGANANGELGDGTTTQRLTPVAVCASGSGPGCSGGTALRSVVAIAAGDVHTCALLSDGTARCWGNNGNGQLGDGTTTQRLAPAAVCASGSGPGCSGGTALSGVVAVAAGVYHTCALLGDGTARCWGRNSEGQLGDGTTTGRHTPAAVCASGSGPGCSGGTALGGVVAMSPGDQHTCALRSDGSGWCWGRNYYGELGDGTTTDSQTPVQVSGLAYALAPASAAGGYHTCALLPDGTARCWGSNQYGQLGDNTTTERHTPVAVSGLSNAVAISAGLYHTCSLLSDGTARCWGYNSNGQLGDGTTTQRLTPVAVCASGSGPGCSGGAALTGVVAIATGYAHTCALLSDGTAKCWGWNSYGQLGDGTSGTDRLTPVTVSGLSNAVAIAVGLYHTCALLSDGTARCWGYNGNGQLGDGTTTQRLTPVAVCASGSGAGCSGGSPLGGVVAIAAGWNYTCALLADGTARCWGLNEYGQLGDNTTAERHTPVAVSGLSNAAAIAAGTAHTCALLSDGSAQCWGNNFNGQLGDNSTTQRLTPVAVSGLSNAAAIAAGTAHTCALLSDGSVRCWGHNNEGELGDGTTTDSHTPVAAGLDTDSDGCSSPQELYGASWPKPGSTCSSPTACYSDTVWYDFYDVPLPVRSDPAPNGFRNRAVSLLDVLAVLKYVPSPPPGGTLNTPNVNGLAYNADKGMDTNGDTVAEIPPDGVPDGRAYDRSISAAPNPPWDAGPPDGTISLAGDVIPALKQYGLDCSGSP